MFRLLLGKDPIYIMDIVSISNDLDDKLEFNLLFRKSDYEYAALYSKRISFKDFTVAEKSKEIMIVPEDQIQVRSYTES